MRVGIEATATANTAGSGVLTRHLVQQLNRLGHTVVLLTDRPPQVSTRRRRPVQRLVSGLRRILWTQIGLPRAVKKEGLDLLVCPAQMGPVRLPKPLVLFLYDLSFLLQPEMADRLFGLYLRRLVPRLIESAQRIVVISEATLMDLRRAFPAAATRADVAFPGPGEAEAMLAEPSDASRADRPRRYVLMVGTLEPRKNHVRALEAFQLFRMQTNQDWRMVIVGSPGWSYEPILQSAQDTGLGDAVVFLGHVSLAELGALYRSAGALFFPSLKEGFGLPILEAMALGCPVITSDRSSTAEVANSSAQLVDPLDVRAMAEGLHAVLGDERRRSTLILKGKRRAEQFSWQSFGDAVERSIRAAASS